MPVNKTYFLGLFFIMSLACSEDANVDVSLKGYLEGHQVEMDNVIACAASDVDGTTTQIFLYPRAGGNNVRYYETSSALVDKTDFSNYYMGHVPIMDVFNGYLQKFDAVFAVEKWVIVTLEENGKIHVSNPIRVKHISRPTEYLPQNIDVDGTTPMPLFMWHDGMHDDSAIYFQVVSDAQNNLLSGTYTYEKKFRYYDLQNVVLNVTRESPPQLNPTEQYTFTLMGVSEDNWVNLFSTVPFKIGQ